MRNRYEAESKGIRIGHYDREAWLSECLWHQYHMGANDRWWKHREDMARYVEFADEETVAAGEPPHPQGYPLETFYPWRRVREIAAVVTGAGQLELFA